MRIFVSLLILILTAKAHGSAQNAFNKIRPLIFRIKTAADSNLGKSSYGTGFVVDKSGLLLTNYHVIADAIWNEESNKVYVEINGNSLPLEIRAVDFVHDLAVVSVQHQFAEQIHIAKVEPNHGEEIYSLGLPADVDWTVINGVYNGVVTHGPYELIHMSTPLNPGMSGGPTVNSKSELVAVNVSGLRSMQQISFGIPITFVRTIIARAAQKTLSTDELLEQLRAQLLELQSQMTEQVINGFLKPKLVEGKWMPDFGKKMRCWGSSASDDKAPKFNGRGENCSLDHSVTLSNGQYSGTFDARFAIFKNEKVNWLSWYLLISRGWNPTYEIVPTFKTEAKLNYNQPKCIRERVYNKAKEVRTVNLCIQQMNPLTNLYDAYLQIYESNGSKLFVGAGLTLAGFTSENLKKILAVTLGHSFSESPK